MPDTPPDQNTSYLPPFLFPPVGWCVQAVRKPERAVLLDIPFCKQTLLSRFCVKGANNPIVVSCPVVHHTRRSPLAEVYIDSRQPWNRLALKSLESAYRKAPYWEYYADEVTELLLHPPDRLVELVIQSHRLVNTWLSLPLWHYVRAQPENLPRFYFDKIKLKGAGYAAPKPYQQTFPGFMPEVSYLDLIFNLGPRTVQYLVEAADAFSGATEAAAEP
jgi:hypothetical protein